VGISILSLDSILVIFMCTMICDVWVAVCQPFVKRIYDDIMMMLCAVVYSECRSGGQMWRFFNSNSKKPSI